MAYADGPGAGSLAFAARFGFEEVDRQVEQVLDVGTAPEPPPLEGIELATVAERPELVRAAYPLACVAYADMPLVRPLHVSEEEWLREEATLPEGSLVVLHRGEIVGYAGLLRLGDEHGVAEHGLTAVRRDFRRRGLATALKRRQQAFAAGAGIAELVTWTQRGNEDMQRVNERLGYRRRSETVTLRGDVGMVRAAAGSRSDAC